MAFLFRLETRDGLPADPATLSRYARRARVGDVPPPAPKIDVRTYAELLDEAIARIPVDKPDWNDFNRSDAGVTLLHLFAYLADALLAYLEEGHARRRRRRRRAVLLTGVSGAAVALWGVWRNNTAAPLSRSAGCPT
jgi:hypothetical protein